MTALSNNCPVCRSLVCAHLNYFKLQKQLENKHLDKHKIIMNFVRYLHELPTDDERHGTLQTLGFCLDCGGEKDGPCYCTNDE